MTGWSVDLERYPVDKFTGRGLSKLRKNLLGVGNGVLHQGVLSSQSQSKAEMNQRPSREPDYFI